MLSGFGSVRLHWALDPRARPHRPLHVPGAIAVQPCARGAVAGKEMPRQPRLACTRWTKNGGVSDTNTGRAQDTRFVARVQAQDSSQRRYRRTQVQACMGRTAASKRRAMARDPVGNEAAERAGLWQRIRFARIVPGLGLTCGGIKARGMCRKSSD